MSTLTIKMLKQSIGAEVVGVDADRLLQDDALPEQIRRALEQNGVLVFPKLNLDSEIQVTVCQKLGEVDLLPGKNPGIMRVSLDPSRSASAEYLHGTFNWHMDGVTLPIGRNPAAATVLTAVAVAERGGQTEFASTYGAYESLTPEEQERYGELRVLHTVAATMRLVNPNPSAEQEASWAGSPAREQPLVWRHRSGRRSLVMGATAERVIGMDDRAGRAVLDDLLDRATGPDRVYRHEWSVGDTVMWDNRGVLHRVVPYEDDSPREMIRTSLLGDEPIE